MEKFFGSNVAFIMDDNLRLIPKGGVGELCISGAQLARGYFQLEAETSKQFVSSPNINNGQRMYRTGDLVRLNTKNEVEILGRKDQQIKLNGFRIELTEIESTVWSHPRVNHVVVDVVKQNGNSFLAAWFVPEYAKDNVEDIELPLNDQNTQITKELILQLQDMTSTKLSKYMVPHHWIPVNYIPRSTSGKIDKKKLVQLAEGLNCKLEELSKCIIPAETDMERILTKIWSEIFAIEASHIGRNKSFFEVGGNSISAIHLIERLRKQSIFLSVSSVFENPVLKYMALSCDKTEQKVPSKTNEPEDKFLLPDSMSLNSLRQLMSDYGLHIDNVDYVYPSSPLQDAFFGATLRNKYHYVGQHVFDIVGQVEIDRFWYCFSAGNEKQPSATHGNLIS